MVTRRAAELLLELAARRWPAEVRDDLRREWAAELHVLAESGRRTKMVGFAVSLAVSRAGAPIVDRTVMRGRAGRTVAALLLSPIACVGIVALGGLAMFSIYDWLMFRASWAERAQKPIWAAFTIVLAVVLAVFAARWARHNALDGPLRIALGVVLPVGVTVILFMYVTNAESLAGAVPGLLLWLAGLTLALWAAASLAARGRLRTAWWVGVLGALVAADLAVILAVVDTYPGGIGAGPTIDARERVDPISAPLWLFACWTDWNFGLPRPIQWEIFLITNRVLIEPMLYLACMPYALAYTIRAARSAPTAPVALVQTRSATGWTNKASGKPHRGPRAANG
ncbi:hypothetical protein PSN13_02362 [Micromonospora saelicesensis]|uniref:Uncharacterized protein n=1 Tax=Micromonospora saelicesensis TaxID=285676 RepID=A0A328NXW5_9ACTN|nr:hypothetical protein [Micromonospora saelicesensis]RAO35938.1 hypothetical protein PSN13_02362 [Micromonospora saelicesensis]